VIANLTACDSEMSHPDKILTQIWTRILSWQENSQSLYIDGVENKINGVFFLETLSECCDLSQASFRKTQFWLASQISTILKSEDFNILKTVQSYGFGNFIWN